MRVSERSQEDTEEDKQLVKYLSGLKLQEGDKEELLLPAEEPPPDFDQIYKRCCRRTLYPYKGFSIVLSKEVSYVDGEEVATVCKHCDNKHDTI